MTTRLRKLLEEIAGINPRVLGDKNLSRVVRERMSACKLADEEQYLEKARISAHEIEALIEAVVVPETSFFRDKGPFTFLSQYVRDEWIPARGTGPLRVLSAPCSSGEEPYSIAIVLQEAGLKPDQYKIEGMDISRALLYRAERAMYTAHSFRGVQEGFRDLYFVPVGREFVLKDEIRNSVRFIHGNLMDELVLADKKPYAIIFCRNLLIYLGAEARVRVVKTIERLLAPDGLLFVGHAETSSFPAAKYAPLHHRGAFGFRKVKAGGGALADAIETVPLPIASSTPPPKTTQKVLPETKQTPAPAAVMPKPKDSIEAARQLADQGRLTEAAAICERLLLDDGTNADVHCLLGTVLHGLGNLGQAEECFNRAIYLDERCYDAIVHLSLIKEHRRDPEGAEVLRRRAARIHLQTRNS
jgi:chemotaxis protein methyltransferase WspC